MTYGYTPGGEQGDPAGPPPPGYGAAPGYPGQAGAAAGPPGWATGPGQQVPPGYGPAAYGQPGYGPPPGYGQPAYYPPGYGPPVYPPPGPQPPAYGGWAVSAIVGGVLFSLLVGLPTAIAGHVYGSKVSRLWASGDVQGAYSASRKARGWLTASTVFDLLGLILVVFLVVTHVSASGVSFTKSSVVPASVSVVQQPAQTGMTMVGCHGHLGSP